MKKSINLKPSKFKINDAVRWRSGWSGTVKKVITRRYANSWIYDDREYEDNYNYIVDFKNRPPVEIFSDYLTKIMECPEYMKEL